jgi:ABC-type multidrug transport system fused ATPase/permease subunit
MKSRRVEINTTILRSFKILDYKDRVKLGLAVVLQVMMSLLDLLGVLLIGILGAIAVNGLQGNPTGNRVNMILSILGIKNLTLQQQAFVLGCLAAAVLISRTLFSVYFMRRILYFLSNKGASVTAKLVYKILSQPLTTVKEKSSQEILYACTVGVQTITLGILGILAVVISDSFLLLVMVLGLFLVDPIVALCTLVIFLGVGFLLNKLMHKRANNLGRLSAELNVKSNTKIIEVLSSYRESVVRNRRGYYAHNIGEIRHKLANANAELTFMPNVSKYVIEGTLIAGTLFICGIQFALNDAVHAIGVLTIFLAAGSRIAPAVLRMQQSIIYIKSNLGLAEPTLNLIESMSGEEPKAIWSNDLDSLHEGFIGEVSMKGISVQYPSSNKFALNKIDIEIKFGDIIAVVGPSGAGKTTFVDTLLGIIEPTSGEVRISGLRPLESIETWPGAMAYVPQEVSLIDGTILENITLGFSPLDIDFKLISDALRISYLTDFVDSLPNKIETRIGESGMQLSGGQRQRIGIARAVLSKPALLVLDEATSALDAETEQSISKAIASLKGKVTVIIIAHRLSTVRDADKVLYLEDGEIIALGTFDEVRQQVPNFDKQAKLMGL